MPEYAFAITSQYAVFRFKLMIDNFYPTHIEVQQVYLLLNFVLILILDVYRVSA